MDILEQAEQAAKSGSNLVKAELLKSVPLIVSELEKLTKDDSEFTNGGRYDESFESTVGDIVYQNGLDEESAMIDAASLNLFLMLEDCEKWQHYQTVVPNWMKEWRKKAEEWLYA